MANEKTKSLGMIMAEESDALQVLKDHDNQASLEQISKGLDVAKYGFKSAYALLQSLRTKNVMARQAEMFIT